MIRLAPCDGVGARFHHIDAGTVEQAPDDEEAVFLERLYLFFC
jgi:hypothetical protein